MKNKFNIGDRVLICYADNRNKLWAEGTIVNLFSNAAIVDFTSFDGKTKGCTGVPYADLIKKEG